MAGYNKLRYLPGSIKRLRLDSLDLAPNSFDSANMRDVNNLGVLSLLECAARKVINYRLALIVVAFVMVHFRIPKDAIMQVLMLLIVQSESHATAQMLHVNILVI